MATAAPPKTDSAPNAPPAWKPELHEIPVDAIDVGANVRADVGDVSELAASIASQGVISPVRVAEVGGGRYELVYGQRRLAAAKVAGLERIPAIVDNGADVEQTRLVRQLLENLQREDLNAVDTAKAYRGILDQGVTQRELATLLGIAQPTIANTLRVLKAPDEIQAKVAAGELTRSHVEALASLPAAEQKELARRAVEHGLSTRDLEEEIGLASRRAREEQRREEARKNEKANRLRTVISLLSTKKADPKKVTLAGHPGTVGDLLEQLKTQGWKVKVGFDHDTPAKGICDCTALRLEIRYDYMSGQSTEKFSLAKTCISSKHQEAARKADREKWEAEQAEQRAAAAKAAEEREAALAPAVTAITAPIPLTKAKLILMALIAGERHGNGWWNASPWIQRVTGKAATYDGWMVQLWKAIDGLEHEQLLAEVARVVAERILDAGPDPAREALSSLYNAGERVAAKKAKAKS